MADLAVAVAHQAVEQLGQTDGGAGRRLAVHRFEQGPVQAGGARHVVACAAQQQVAHGKEAVVGAVGQNGNETADELPPVAQRRPGQVAQAFGQLRVVVLPLGVFDHGGGSQELQAGLPEEIGRQVPFQGRGGVRRPPGKLRQRQGELLQGRFLQTKAGVHRALLIPVPGESVRSMNAFV